MNTTQPSIIQFVANELDVPNEAYDKAKKRYESIGEWLCRPDSRSSAYSPHVHSQGSFRLGTAIQTSEGFDLDMSIRLEESISPSTHSQADLKELVGEDLEEYRKAHGIKKKLDEKARCWRLEYADSYHFHIDGVPCIPDSDERRQYSERAIREFLEDPHVAAEAAQHAASITDVNEDSYRDLGAQWPPSNPEGYAKWFESRMRLAQKLLAERTFQYSVASVDDLPAWQWRVPLQQAIQILKRHRDIMYEHDEDRKPISIIITTLAARAYTGESDLEAALASILEGMERGVNSSSPYVQNPVWPEEDFAARARPSSIA